MFASGDQVEGEGAEFGAVRGDEADVRREGGVGLWVGLSGESVRDAEVVQPGEMRERDCYRLVGEGIARCGGVEGAAGVEVGSRFGVDCFACCED